MPVKAGKVYMLHGKHRSYSRPNLVIWPYMCTFNFHRIAMAEGKVTGWALLAGRSSALCSDA